MNVFIKTFTLSISLTFILSIYCFVIFEILFLLCSSQKGKPGWLVFYWFIQHVLRTLDLNGKCREVFVK